MKRFTTFALTVVVAMFCSVMSSLAADKKQCVTSPDGHITATVAMNAADGLTLSISLDGTTLLEPSPIGLTLADGTVIGTRIGKVLTGKVDETVEAPFYRQKEVTYQANQKAFILNNNFNLIVRASNEGVAYRFVCSTKPKCGIIKNETATYKFAKDFPVWFPYVNSSTKENPFACSFENTYTECALSEANERPAFLPTTVDCGVAKVTLLESDLEAYPGMMVTASAATLSGIWAPYPKTMDYHPYRHMTYVKEGEDFIAKFDKARAFPWRAFAITTSDTQMPVNNLVFALATPNRIGDISWIKPGKVAWDWWNNWNVKGVDFKSGVNMDTYKYYVDFAAANGIEYVVLDEGWYNTASGDLLDIVPAIDLPALVKYANGKGVDIVLWMVFNCIDENLETVCKTYAEMGIKGFKIDFLDRNDQTAVEMAYRITECAAKNHIFVDYHGFWKPTGMSRTYPNLLNYEGVYGLEQCKWQEETADHPRYDVTIPYIRMMAGYMDYTPGAMRNRGKGYWHASNSYPASMGTRCHQAGMYVVYDAPFEMLCDAPTMYEAEPEYTKFLTSIPTVFDETIVPAGQMGEYIVTARRSGDNWYVGGMTNWTGRTVKVSTSFLPAGEYKVEWMMDGINANRNAEDYQSGSATFSTSNIPATVDITMANGGGFVAKLTKIN